MKRPRVLCCCLLLTVIAFAPAPAPARQDIPSIFAGANSDYQQGDFATAERRYRQLLEMGVNSGTLYYNLGNACFKQKKLGEAVYYWEKARQKLPGDSDVGENLALAGLLIVDRIDVPEDPLPVRWLSAATHWLSVSQEAWLALILFVMANLLFGIYQFAARPRRALWSLSAALALVVMFVLVSGSLAWKIYESKYRQQGVVVEQSVAMRSGPGPDYITVATIHEGIKVRIRGQAEGWYQVVLPNGWSGWLPGSALLAL